jgi:hypothetical protein
VKAPQFVVTGIAMTFNDFRSGVEAAFSDVGYPLDATTERSSFTAAVSPLKQIPPADQRLSPERLRQIDRAFFGPFFREVRHGRRQST